MLSISDTVRVRRPAGLFTAAANARIAVIMRVLIALAALALGAPLMAQEQGAGEANLKLPDLRIRLVSWAASTDIPCCSAAWWSARSGWCLV